MAASVDGAGDSNPKETYGKGSPDDTKLAAMQHRGVASSTGTRACACLLAALGCGPALTPPPGPGTGGTAPPPERGDEETRPDQMADFEARTLGVVPEYPEPGERSEIRFELGNRSLDRRTVEVRFVADAQVLATRTVELAAQAVQTITVPWTPSKPGLSALSAAIDPEGRHTELERGDNALAIDVPVVARPLAGAELVLGPLSAVSQSEQPTAVRATIRNAGAVEVSAPLVVRQGALRQVSLIGPVPPGKAIDVELPFGGDVMRPIEAEVNPRFRSAEQRPLDNVRSIDPRPATELRVEAVSLEGGASRSDGARDLRISFRIVNAGRQNIDKPFQSRVEWTDAFVRVASFEVTTERLAAGGSVSVSHAIGTMSGKGSVKINIDSNKRTLEAIETDNLTILDVPLVAAEVDRWRSIGPSLITGGSPREATGRLSAIAFDTSSPGTIYVAGQSAGIWKTTDGGVSWNPISDAATVRVAAIALDPNNFQRLWLVTPREGVFRSEDAGTSFSQISMADLDAIVHGNVLLVNPVNSDDLLLASNRGVYRSLNGGATWELRLPGGVATGLMRSPSQPATVFAALSHDTDSEIAGVYRSFDGGQTWSAKPGCPGGALPANDAGTKIRLAQSGDQLFASYRLNDPDTFKLFRTHGIGCSVGGVSDVSWEPGFTASGDVAQTFWSGLWADPLDPNRLYLGGTNFWRSTNNGGSFALQTGAHADHHLVAFDPFTAGVLYSLDDGGIYRSPSHGESGSFQLFGRSIANVEFYDHVSAPTKPDLVIGGNQDNGNLKTTGGSLVWQKIRGGDGGTVDIDPLQHDTLYTMGQFASSIERSTNAGASFTNAAGGLPSGATCFNLHFLVDRSPTTRLLASCEALFQTTNSGTNWSELFKPPTGAIVRAALDVPQNVDYAAASDGKIYRGPGGSGFASIFTHPALARTSDLEVDLDQPDVLYASFDGTSTARVYRLARTSPASTGFTAQNITSDLPSGRLVRTLAVDRNRPFTIYAGTDKGVFRGRSTNAGQTWFWTSYSNGMPPADVRDLDVNPGSGILRAATFGRSAYEVNTGSPIGSLLAIQGKIVFLRAHDVGSGFGPPIDFIDGEVVVKLDSDPLRAFGFQLRTDAAEADHRGMLDLLRNAMKKNRTVRIEYVRTGLRNGRLIRVIQLD